jgi:hypothetical protein
MAGVLQHLRSSTLNKRPNPASMVDGQLAINYASGSPGAFFKDTNGNLVKVGPVHVGSSAPNVSPASGGTAGNSLGEQWLDTSGGTYVFKIWDGGAWRSEAGEFVNVTGDTMTGALGIIAGSASTPGLFFSGDANSGLYSPGADQVAISTNGTGRLFVSDNGVATGGAPQFGFGGIQVRNNFIYLNEDGANTVQMYLRTASSEPAIQIATNHPFKIQTNNQERLRVTADGKVGLGTSAPQAQLSVFGPVGTLNDTGGTLLLATDAAGTDVGEALGAGVTFAQRWAAASGPVRVAGIYGVKSAGTGNFGGSLSFYTQPLSGADMGERLRITANGFVGIGTTSPQNTFVVSNAGAEGLEIIPTGGTPNVIAFNRSTAAYAPLTLNGSVHILQTSGTERARIDSSGRLLVGTSNAVGGGELQVKGTTGDWGRLTLLAGKGSTLATNNGIGNITFADHFSGGAAASITCEADAGWGTNDYPGRLVFSTTADGAASPTERMRISSDGLVSCSHSTANQVVINAENTNASFASAVIRPITSRAAGTSCLFFYAVANSVNTFLVYNNGNVQNTNNSYAGISDFKLKENIVDATSQWSDIKTLQVRKYNFKEETGQQTHTQIGLIAQEVELVSPGLVSESPDRDEDGNDLGTTTKSVNYSVLYMKAVKALQEAMERIEQLETEMAAVKTQLS